MRKLSIAISLFLISFLCTCNAQETKATLLDYNWDEARSRVSLSSEEEHLPKIILFSKTVIEYVFENQEFVEYTLDHMIIRVNSDEAIESSNKINISMAKTMDIVQIKARSISKDGKIINLDKSNIKELKNDEEDQSSKIFAIEGVENGSEIEYFYVKKISPSVYGHETFQYSSPVKQAYFQLISPDHLSFLFKSYNGFPSIKDTVIDSKNLYTAQGYNIPELRDEEYANYQKCRMRVEYKLGYNLAKGKKELNTWAILAQNQHAFQYTYTSKELKEVEKLAGKLNIKPDAPAEEKIKSIENYIKTNIFIQETYDNVSLDKIIQNKYATIQGIVKLYIALFKLANVKVELVLTSERDEIPFDGSFESWRLLNNYLFYFPATDKFLTPEETNYRYPLIPYNLTYTDGLFLKEVKVGEFSSFITSIKFIPPMNYNLSGQKIEGDISFDVAMDEADLKITNTLKGYHAVFIQPYYSQVPDDKKHNLLEDIMKGITADTKYTKLEARNTDPNSTIDQPFIVYAEVKGPALLEKAGNKVLFKVGELLDKQAELYQDKQRMLDIECDYNREYVREFRIKIPDNFTIKNPDDITMNHYAEKDGNKVYGFISSYELKDKVLIIKIDEFYKEIAYPKEKYEDYRKVVNAAADFNKVVLVFEPKS